MRTFQNYSETFIRELIEALELNAEHLDTFECGYVNDCDSAPFDSIGRELIEQKFGNRFANITYNSNEWIMKKRL